MNEYQKSIACSRCKTIESNMYYFTWTTKISKDCIVLCNDCIGACLTYLFIHPDSNSSKLIKEYLNENIKKAV